MTNEEKEKFEVYKKEKEIEGYFKYELLNGRHTQKLFTACMKDRSFFTFYPKQSDKINKRIEVEIHWYENEKVPVLGEIFIKYFFTNKSLYKYLEEIKKENEENENNSRLKVSIREMTKQEIGHYKNFKLIR